jgi:pimeloyl-ACP methyl ester carboxylesterase
MTQVPAFTALGSGPTVLMLHGIGGGHLAFAPQVETFASQGYRAVAWDMPGYGHSAPIEPYTFKGLKCGDVTLIGHSMGGMVAQEVVARRPDLVNRLVLCGTSPAFGRKPDGQSADEWQRNFVQSRTAPLDAGQSMQQLAQQLVPGMVGPSAMAEGVKLAAHCMSQVPASTYRRALEALVTFDRRDGLAAIHVPTLLIAGEHDRNAPPSVMKKMADAIRSSSYHEMKGIGHLMNLEAPDAFDGAVLNFLALPRILH